MNKLRHGEYGIMHGEFRAGRNDARASGVRHRAGIRSTKTPLRQTHRLQRGFSLVEVMVSIVIALIMLAGIIQLFVSNKQAYRIQESFSLLSENARFSLSQLQYHLRMADHWGSVQPDTISSSAPAIAGDCSANYATDNIGLEGYEGGAAVPTDLEDCIAAGDYVPNSDIVVLRFGGTPQTRVLTADLEADELYVRSSAGRRGRIFQGSDIASLPSDLYNSGNPDPDNIQNYPYRFIAYFVRPCSSQSAGTAGVCDAADDDTPTLTRLTLDGASLVQEDVAEGVEQLQILYGIDTNGNMNADTYLPAASVSTNQWPSVVSVRFDLLVRTPGIDISVDTTGDTYNMVGNYTYTVPADARHHRRKMFSSVVQIRNQSRS